MNYPCCLIQDLLPLYHDGVCSEQSAAILQTHLAECPCCRDSYARLCEADAVIPAPQNAGQELQKAASLRAVKRKMHKRQIAAAALALAMLAAAVLLLIGVLKNTEQVISRTDAISVSMVDGSLIGRLRANQANRLTIKQVTAASAGEPVTCLFFCLSGTKWDDLVTGADVFSEYVLCPAEKGAEKIDRVFYYTGDYTGLESLDPAGLQKVMQDSALLWSR